VKQAAIIRNAADPSASGKDFDFVEIASAYLGVTRRVTVWFPPGYRARGRTLYRALYLNDGQNLFDPRHAFAGVTWGVAETASWLIRRREIPPIVVVGIDHGGLRRAREYLPIEDDRNPYARKPLGREYAKFVVDELKPFIDRTYRVAGGARNAAFGGSSYGAVAALYTVLVRPGVFGRLLLESPSLYVGRGYLLQRARAARRWPARVYLGVGTMETRRPDWNQQTVADVLKLAAILRKAGLGPARLQVVIEEGGTHSESAWGSRLPGALKFLFS
jgi:predicted alpha/beta superfamily hydrolase